MNGYKLRSKERSVSVTFLYPNSLGSHPNAEAVQSLKEAQTE